MILFNPVNRYNGHPQAGPSQARSILQATRDSRCIFRALSQIYKLVTKT